MKTHTHYSNFSHLSLFLATVTTAIMGANTQAETVYGVSDQLNELITFDSASPGTLLSAHNISGLANGEQIRGIDWFNSTLYGLGSGSHLYIIDPSTGVATQVGTGTLNPTLNGIDFGFNADNSQFYVSSDLGQNLTINPVTGVAATGPNYTGATLDALAYNYLTTGFYGISADTHDLYSLNPLTGGVTLVGPSGVNFVDEIGFDISGVTGTGYFAGTVGGQSEFFNVDLATGAFTLVGDIGTPGEITSGLDSIALVPEPKTSALAALGTGLLITLLLRRGKERDPANLPEVARNK